MQKATKPTCRLLTSEMSFHLAVSNSGPLRVLDKCATSMWRGLGWSLESPRQGKPTRALLLYACGVLVLHGSTCSIQQEKAQWALTIETVKVLDSMLGLNSQSVKPGKQMEVKKKVVGVYHVEVIEQWLRKQRLIYTGATRHPLILSIRDGTVHLSAFRRWLGQDYIFVRAFVPFAASVLIKAWKESDDISDVELLLKGMAALNDEIEWFKREASKWNVELYNIVPHKTTEQYCRFLESLMRPEVEYTVAITALWAIEAVYQESFAHCLEDGSKTPPELREICQRWGNEAFGQYCTALRNIANRRLEVVSDDLLKEGYEDMLKQAEVVFLRVLEYEVEFWNMCRGDS